MSILRRELANLRLKAADRDEWQQVALKLRAEMDEAHRLYGCHGETLLNTLHRLRKSAAGFESKSKLFREKLTDCEQALARSEQQASLATEKLKEMRHALELVVEHYNGQVSCFHPAVCCGVDVLETVKKALA